MAIAYVAVHGGAGVHNHSSDPQIKRALRRACTRALKTVAEGASAASAVETALSILENDECLNAGYGSNLTVEGEVECDAAIMDGRTGDFGSVGALSGVRNPIKAAHIILQRGRRPDALGRIHPMTLVSGGAHTYAETNDLETVPPETMISPSAQSEWQKWKQRLETDETKGESTSIHNSQDTVGAVAWANDGGMAAGVSSGGLLLKYPGRIGEAAVFGAGCWAQQRPDGEHSSATACSVSGAGEYITRSALARSIGEALEMAGEDGDIHEILRQVLLDCFWTPSRRQGNTNPNAGVLLLTRERHDGGLSIPRLWCAFTTESMAIGYASSKDAKPKTTILRRPQTPLSGRCPPIFITSLPLGKD